MKRKQFKNNLIIQTSKRKFDVLENISNRELKKTVEKLYPNYLGNLKTAEERIEAIHKTVLKDPDLLSEYTLLKQAQSATDEYMTSLLEKLSTSEVLKKMKQLHAYTSLGSVMFFRDVNYRGRSIYVNGGHPHLGWPPYRFNDEASSLYNFGIAILFEHSWYRGNTQSYFISNRGLLVPDLGIFGFNDITSSAMIA